MDYNLLSNYVKPKRLVDIGAHLGNFTQNIISFSPNCESIMVEANPHCEPYLKKLGHLYHMIALSNYVGRTNLYIEKLNNIGTGASIYKENTEWYEIGKFDLIEVDVNTLDNLNLFPNETIDLIKIDVQGSELDILMGGFKTTKRTKYVLLEVSTLEYNLKAPLVDKIVKKMREVYFKIEDIVDYKYYNNQVFQMDFLFKNIYF